jgi:large subunit ribosomal protein L40e
MGKFPIADAELAKIKICKKCKARNFYGAVKCRKCGSPYLRPKRKDLKTKGK